MKIITIPHPTLRQTAEPVVEVDAKLKNFVKDLQQTLATTTKPRGVGLAAPQVDSLQRIFVTNLPRGDESISKYFINPEIVKHSDKQVLGVDPEEPDLEGCLSIPGIYGPVPRWEWVEVEFQQLDSDGLSHHQERFENFAARVMQHELDHLNGILFTDYSLELDLPVYRQEKNKWIEIDRELIEVI